MGSISIEVIKLMLAYNDKYIYDFRREFFSHVHLHICGKSLITSVPCMQGGDQKD